MSIDQRPVPLPEEVAPRGPVPSDRERADAPACAPAERPDTADARTERPSFRRWARSWHPRELLAGSPAFPIAALGLFQVIQQWDDSAWGVLVPDVRAEFQVDTRFILTLNAFLGLVLLQLLGPVFGYLTDRISRVGLLRAGAIVANASSLVTGVATGMPHLIAGRIGVNVGVAVLTPTGLPLIADYYPSRTRARLLGALGIAGGIGAIAGPLLGGWLGARYGWRISLVALGGVALGVTVLTFFLREPPRGYQDRLEMGADEAAARREQPPAGWREGWRTAASILTIRRLWVVAPFSAAINFAVISFMGSYYAEEFGVGTAGRGYIVALSLAIGAGVLIVAAPLGDRILTRNPGRFMSVVGAIFVVQALTFLALWATPRLGFAVGVNMVMVGLNGLFLPAFYTLLTLVIPARMRGLGIMTLAPFIALGAPLVALVLSVGSSTGLRPAMLLFVPMCLVAGVIVGTGAAGVAADIRSAKAASMAEEAARTTRAKLLVARDVQVAYDGVPVLFGIDIDVADGEILALLGTNGAGKSTLLRAIAGVTEASGGAIFFEGRDITHVPPHGIAAAGVVLLPGGRAVFPTLTVEENLRAARWLARDAAPPAEEVLSMFPVLRDRLGVRAGDLSGGEQQMLALGQAFLMRPRLLMIDELSLGLAPPIVEQLLDTLRTIHAAGTTIVLVEQSVNLALSIAQRAIFMEKGRAVYDGAADELLGRPDLLRSVFLGGAAAARDIAPPQARRSRAGDRRVVLAGEGLTVDHGGVRALAGVSFALHEREIVALIGANGAGKTTLFDALTGLVPGEGRVVLDGADVTALSPDARARAGLGRSFQNARLFPSMTVREAITVAHGRHLGAENALAAAIWAPNVRTLERRAFRRADALIELLGLGDAADLFVGELSTAMRRIVDLACVTAAAPVALLLDEPSSGLAQSETEELGPLLQRLVRESGCALALIEHDIRLAASIADRMIAMDLGRVIAEGTPATVLGDPAVATAVLGGRAVHATTNRRR